jgi:outer membrane PBP1 activator LpoA protein
VAAPEPETPAAPPKPAAPTVAPVTLILPLDSPDFRPAAEALRQGFFAAHTATATRTSVDVRRTDASPASVLEAYATAIAGGTRVVVGPLTRSGVSVLAASSSGKAAILALNQPETPVALPPRFYTFGLAVEGESRVAARAAFEQGLRTAAVLSSGTPLARRTRDAFIAEWQALGGKVAASLEATPASGYGGLRAALGRVQFDVAFLAAEAGAARQLRPYVGAAVPVFSTSQINDGRSDPVANLDMNGVRFTDVPWIVQPGSPAVVGFPRPQGMGVDLERFYALGIDAQRIAMQLADGRSGFGFDGVTGRIEVGSGGVVERTPRLAVFRDGAPVGE